MSTLFTFANREIQYNIAVPNSIKLPLPNSVYCHSNEYNRIQWGICTPARCDVGNSIGVVVVGIFYLQHNIS